MFKLMKKIAFICLAIFMASTYSSAAHAENKISVSGAAVWLSSPYKGHDNLLIPFPMIHWEAKYGYVRGYEAGVFLWTNDNKTQELSTGLRIGRLAFDHDDTDNRQLALLDDRDRALDAYIQYILRTDYGTMGASLAHDVTGNADGFVADIFYRYPIHLGALSITPGAGIQWTSADRTDYYYGISSSEARRSGLSSYDPDSTFSAFLSLGSKFMITEQISLFGAIQVNLLGDEVKDSPMVDEDTTTSATFGITYSF